MGYVVGGEHQPMSRFGPRSSHLITSNFFKIAICLYSFFLVTPCFTTANGDDHRNDGLLVGAELKQGRYFGFVELDSTKEKIAVVADFYLESPEDMTQFPKLNATVKLSFGGFNTHEYYTETFEDLRYDFDNGVLTLDEPNNDLMMTTEVRTSGSDTYITGQALFRSSAVTGVLNIKYETDEPGDDLNAAVDSQEEKPIVPLLEGQYEGECGGEAAAFQIQTVRGLKSLEGPDIMPKGFSHDTAVFGRLAYRNSELCGPNLCTYYNFPNIIYNPLLSKLAIQGSQSTGTCDLRQGNLLCQLRIQSRSLDCSFKKKNVTIRPSRFFTRQHYVRPSADQLQDLPPASPPQNTDLASALRGTFSGYLHNETNDTYQAIRINVMPYSSTNNPHNPNQMMITTTAITYFGRGPYSSEFVTHRYEPRSFYLRPGFTLNGPNTDSYINISEWKKGFIRGSFYSHAFGKVGTVQLVKGDFPDLPAKAKMVRKISGEFEGPMDSSGAGRSLRWFKLLFPIQPSDTGESLVRLSGGFQAVKGMTPFENIERATFDPYTGVFGWVRSRDGDSNIVSGIIDSDSELKLFWPPAPNVSGSLTDEFGLSRYKRTKD